MKAAVVISSSLALLPISLADAAQSCFEEFHQIYEYDDGGRTWDQLQRKACGGEPSGANGPRKARSGARIEVRHSGSELFFHEDAFRWEPVVDESTHRCLGAKEVHRRTTKVLSGGKYYELIEREGERPKREQKAKGRINVPHTVQAPREFSLGRFENLGTSTIAGHECRRFRATVGPGHSSVYCVLELPPKCAAARHLLPLESIVPEQDAHRTEGRTTLLRIGRVGEVLKPGAMSPP